MRIVATRRRQRRRSQAGQVLPLVGIALLLITGVAGSTIDLGHQFVTKRQLQSAADSAALAGATTLAGAAATILSTTPNWNDAAVYAAHDYAAANGFVTTFPASAGASAPQYHKPACYTGGGASAFQEMFFDSTYGTSCTSGFPTTGFTTAVQVNVPPIQQAGFPALPTQCVAGTGNPDNCVQVVTYQKVTNYIMGILGQPTEYLLAVATAYANPGSAGVALPASYAAYVYEPASGCSGQCYTTSSAPTKGALTCTSFNCPSVWANNVAGGGGVQIEGIDGSTLTPAAHVTALESAGHVVNQVNSLTFCDPYGGAGCTANQAPAGTYGYALGASANIYCKSVQAGTPTNACTTTNPPAGTQKIAGNKETYAAETYTQTATATGDDCGGLVLNGDPINASNSPPVFFNANGTTKSPVPASCIPASSEPFTIKPDQYRYIVINHGQYNFDGGLYYVYGTAPVNTATVSGSVEANGIDHSQETTGANGGDWDLCQTSDGTNTKVCPTLTAGVWIGHGLKCDKNNLCGAAVAPSGTTCSGGVIVGGTAGGGGDATDISGSGVSFYFTSTSAGFVSTSEVDSIALNGPNTGAIAAIGGQPMLIDMQNNGWTHLDGNSANANQFQGIVYQTSTATGGGVDINAGAGAASTGTSTATLVGQVLAYSLDFFGAGGLGIDFSAGWSSAGGAPTGGGNNETSLITLPSSLTASGPNAETLTVTYTDEWRMDAWDLSIQVNSLTTYYFSKPIWSISPNTNPASGPYPPQNGYTPSDSNPEYMASDQGSPYYSPPSPYIAGAGTHDYKLHTDSGQPDDTVWEVTGDWSWGNDSNLGGKGGKGGYTGTVSYTFPTPAGTQVSVLMHVVDGDHCGDYDNVSATFNNVGSPGGGGSGNGNNLLVQ